MKNGNLVILGLGAAALYFILRNRDNTPSSDTAPFQTIPQGFTTPMGNVISRDISSPADGAKYITEMFGRDRSVLEKPRANGRVDYYVPRAGGGYANAGSSNITLNESRKKPNGITASKDANGKWTITNPSKPSGGGSAPWNQKYGGKK